MTPGGARVIQSLPYADQARGTLDVYQPRQGSLGAPVVVFIYGGSWQSGDKALYRFVGELLASRGVVAVIPDYRIYPAVRYPDFLRDNALAVRFARDHAQAWGADPHRLFLMGHSAGAYNVAMLALDRRWLARVGLEPGTDIAGVIGLAGPYDFLPLKDGTLKIIFGPEDARADTQPINHVDGRSPPMLLLAGAKDTTVDPGNTTRLAASIRLHGGKVTTRIVPGRGHVRLLASLIPAIGGRALLDEVCNFVFDPGPEANLRS